MRLFFAALCFAASLGAEIYVVPLATAPGYATTLTLRNPSSTAVRCEAIYALPSGGTLRETYDLGVREAIVEQNLLADVPTISTLRIVCNGAVIVTTAIHSSAGSRVFPATLESRASSHADITTATDLAVMEVAGRATRFTAVARDAATGTVLGERAYELAPFSHQLVQLGTPRARVEIRAHGTGTVTVSAASDAAPAAGAVAPLSSFKAAPFVEPRTGLVYMRDRWYDPASGTFLTPDPNGHADSSNVYALCGGDPVNCSDPDGRQARPAPRPPFRPTTRPPPPGTRGPPAPAAAPRYAPGDWPTFRESIEGAAASRPSAAGTRVFRGRTADELSAAEQIDFLAHRRRLRTDATYRVWWEAAQNTPPPILPRLPGVTPHTQRVAMLPPESAAAQQAVAYHNQAVHQQAFGRLDYSRDFVADLENFTPGAQLFDGVLGNDLVLVQFHADTPLGDGRSAKWWTIPAQANQFVTAEDYMNQLALLPEWGERRLVSVARIPSGTAIAAYVGNSRAQMSSTGQIYPGGAVQYRFKDFDPRWIVETRRLP